MRPCEQRRKVLIRARMKTGTGWHDVCIVDLSKRGIGLQAAPAPSRGDYVEIRRGLHAAATIVGAEVRQALAVPLEKVGGALER